jgi:hypothetical protein
MKTKSLIFTIAAGLFASASVLIGLQSCNKTNNSGPKPVGSLDSKKQTLSLGTADATLTNWFKRNANSLGSVAYDQAFSVPLSSGKLYWLFGDTFYDDLDAAGTVPCYTSTTGPAFNYHNSVISQPSVTNFTQTSAPNELYLSSPQLYTDFTHLYFWPCTGVEIGTKIYTYLVENNDTTGYVGGKLGVLNEATNTVDYTTTVLPNVNGISFNIGMFKISTTVYVYGYKTTGVYGNTNIYVAKFSTSAPGTWTFWSGSAWVSSAASAAVIASTSSNAVSVSYIPSKSKFVLVYCAWNFGCGTDDGIYGEASTSATGGFSAATKIYDIPDRIGGNIPFFYTPLIHPEFDDTSNFELTYCINYATACVLPCTGSRANPDQYRPRAIKVPYTLLGL